MTKPTQALFGIRAKANANGIAYYFPVIYPGDIPEPTPAQVAAAEILKGEPYAYSAGLKNFISTKDPETAILIQTLLNEGIILGRWLPAKDPNQVATW